MPLGSGELVVIFSAEAWMMRVRLLVAVAGLTLYDMVKSVERGARLTDIRLVEKSGGKSGTWQREEEEE